MPCCNDFRIERLAAKKAQLAELDDAYSKALSSYSAHSLDTGQTRQSITNHSIGQMKQQINELESAIESLEFAIYGCGVSQGRPAW